MINSQEIKIGTCIRLDNQIFTCIDFQHVKPGKGNTVMRTKLKNVTTGRVLDRTFQVGFKLEDVRIERRPYQYLYKDGEEYIFMNQETFEQAPMAKDATASLVLRAIRLPTPQNLPLWKRVWWYAYPSLSTKAN